MRMLISANLRSLLLTSLAAAWSLAAPLSRATAESRCEIVMTESGPVRGTRTPAGRRYLGIPYAAAPVGERRLRPPQPHPRWRRPLPADRPGHRCPQFSPSEGAVVGDEDCLFLNVYAPPASRRHRRRQHPVMVFFHGGGLEVGNAGPYDPAPLVAQGVVVVTANFRLGALGFMAHPALSDESPDGASGNYGLMDQQRALRWVADNIARFSGDPSRVAIFGVSAGGLSALAHLASPLSAGLFDAAIAQSGSYSLAQSRLADAEAQGAAYGLTLGCDVDDAACLRALSSVQIVATQSSSALGFLPIVDGVVLPESLQEAFSAGRFSRVPIILGTTEHEGSFFVATSRELVAGPLPPEAYEAAISARLGLPSQLVGAITAQYPLDDYPSPGAAMASIITDAFFACNASTLRRLLGQHTTVYGYEFADADAPVYLPAISFSYGAYHSSDLPYLFAAYPGEAPPTFDGAQAALAGTMVRYWTELARSGSPNAPALPRWLPFDAAGGAVQRLSPAGIAPDPQFRAAHRCDFWDSL